MNFSSELTRFMWNEMTNKTALESRVAQYHCVTLVNFWQILVKHWPAVRNVHLTISQRTIYQ